MKPLLNFKEFINESIRPEVAEIWDTFMSIEDEADTLAGDELDEYLHLSLKKSGYAIGDPLSLYMKFKRLIKSIDSGKIGYNQALSEFKDSVDVFMFEDKN